MSCFNPFDIVPFSYLFKLILVWVLFEGAAMTYTGYGRLLVHGFGLYACVLWFMGALRFVAWTFSLPIDARAFDNIFNYAYLIYGTLACIAPLFYLSVCRNATRRDSVEQN